MKVMFSTVPAVVSNFIILQKFTEIVLTWNAPDQPNGEILNYEVTYTKDTIFVENTTDLSTEFAISGLDPGSHVSDISVRAYTSAGPGVTTDEANVTTHEVPCKIVGD